MPTTDISAHETARLELQRVAAHVLARGQHAATGRLGLRVSPGGFCSIPFGSDGVRLRMSGTTLIRESAENKVAQALPIMGRTLDELAEFARVDLRAEFSAGTDTPAVGDVDAPIDIDPGSVDRIAAWFDLTARALDDVLRAAPPWAAPSMPQLWPEHFDLAIDLACDAAAPDARRVNLGGSPGDGGHAGPYLYVGPWTPDRPGDLDFWNASFGAVRSADQITASDDPVASAVAFLRGGIDQLAG